MTADDDLDHDTRRAIAAYLHPDRAEARRQAANRIAAFRAEIWRLAAAQHIPDRGPVPLARAHEMLSVEAIAGAIEAACLDLARASGAGVLAVVFDPATDRRFRHEAVMQELQAGTLIAAGFDARAPINQARLRVPSDRWTTLTPDFAEATADGVAGIIVWRPDEGAPRRSRLLMTTAEVTAWMAEYVANARKSCAHPSARTVQDAAQMAVEEGGLNCDRHAARAGYSALPEALKNRPGAPKREAG